MAIYADKRFFFTPFHRFFAQIEAGAYLRAREKFIIPFGSESHMKKFTIKLTACAAVAPGV